MSIALYTAVRPNTWEAKARGLQLRSQTWQHSGILCPRREEGEPEEPKVKGDSH